MPATRLKHCPVCSYDLRGLPTRHNCPECGFAYDENIQVWRPAKPWKAYLVTFTGLGCVGIWIGAMIIVSIGEPLVTTVRWAFLFAASASVLYTLWRVYVANRKGRCVAVAPAGVFVRTASNEQLIPWDEITAVEPVDDFFTDDSGPHLAQIRTRGAVNAIEIDRIFTSDDEREQFLSAVETRTNGMYNGKPIVIWTES